MHHVSGIATGHQSHSGQQRTGDTSTMPLLSRMAPSASGPLTWCMMVCEVITMVLFHPATLLDQGKESGGQDQESRCEFDTNGLSRY